MVIAFLHWILISMEVYLQLGERIFMFYILILLKTNLIIYVKKKTKRFVFMMMILKVFTIHLNLQIGISKIKLSYIKYIFIKQ